MNKLCKSCKRAFGDKRCFVPNDDIFYTMEYSREVINADGSCKHYDHKSYIDKIVSFLKTYMYNLPKRYIGEIYDFIKYKIVYQIKYGYDIRDCWDLSYTTAKFMLPRLNRIIELKKDSVPLAFTQIEYVNKYNLFLYFPNKTFTTDMDDCGIAWKNVLTQIYYSLDYTVNKYEDRFSCLVTNDHGETNVDRHKLYDMHDKVEEGFRLLGIFFQNLWD